MIHLERGQGEILRDVLHLIASHPEAEAGVHELLDLAQKLAVANGVEFFLFEEPQLHLMVGTGSTLSQGTLRDIAISLQQGISVNPQLPKSAKSEAPFWIAAPIHVNGNVVGLLWMTCSTRPNDDTLAVLGSCLDGITIFASNIILKDRQENTHRFMNSLLSSISDPLLVLDDDKNVLLMNPAAEGVFSALSTEAGGKSLREVVKSDDLAAFAEGTKAELDEWQLGNKSFVPAVQVVHDAKGHTEGWILALRDITRFKKLNRNQSEFVRIIAHDLRSPLTAMQGFASMMGMVGELNERQAHFVDRILSGITQMTSLVENIQDAGRYDPENGFYEMSRSQCDLIEMVDRIVSNHLVPAEKQELSISVVTGDDVPIINIDSHMLERAITNLLDNAIKYTPNGSKIEVGVRRDRDQVVVSIKDSGYGISPENQKNLFERHVRIARQEHKKVKGSGLGLFIVRSVARRHGGEAWVDSVEGEGSTFNIGIPLKGSNLVGSSSD